MPIQLEVLADAEALAGRAVDEIAAASASAIGQQGSFSFAVSGGSTPRRMLELLAARGDIAWNRVHLFQVDERIAPEGDPDRNLEMLHETLLREVEPATFAAMPVTAQDLDTAAVGYEEALVAVAGRPPVLDLVHLGLGDDGHTASLVPGDPVLDVIDRDVAITGEYGGRRRMTLTRAALDRARRRMWLVSGAARADALARLLHGDITIPATLVTTDHSVVMTDRAAATGGTWAE